MGQYCIGKPVLFTVGDMSAIIGEIVKIIGVNSDKRYQIRVVSNQSTEASCDYYVITEDQIVKPKRQKIKVKHDEWVIANIAEINKTFQRDVSGLTMILAYNSLEDVEKDFDEYAHDENLCRRVLNKWVILIC